MNDNVTATLGLQLLNDIAGTSEFSALQFLPALNLSVRVAENTFISGAFMGGIRQQRFDPSKLILGDQFFAQSNGVFSVLPMTNQVFNKTSVDYFDISTGVSLSSSFNENADYYLGAGLFHISNPKVGFFEGNQITLNKKVSFNAGLSYSISDLNDLIIYGDYFCEYGINFENINESTFQTGILLKRYFPYVGDNDYAITGGILYRWDDAIIPVIQMQMSSFIIGASYDVNISKLVVASQARGGFELTLSYQNIINSSNPDLRSSRCPGFGRKA